MFRGRSEMTEAIQRELEKERIREEIIAEEIARKSILEAEVRKELMMEREMMAMRSDGGSSSPFKLLSLPPSHKNMFEPRILHWQPIGTEERIAVFLEEKYGHGGHRHEIKGFEAVPFQRSGDSPKIKGIPTPLLGNSQKEVIGLGKPNGETQSGIKWKSAPPVAGGSSLHSDSLKKKHKEEWSCAICQVSATSERDFNVHLQGKKHQAKEVALIARKTGANFGLGVAPKKPIVKPVKLASRTVDFSSLEKKSKTRKESVERTPSTNKTSSTFDSNDLKKKLKEEWSCAICQVRATSERDFNEHLQGKKHQAKEVALIVQKTGANFGLGVAPKKPIVKPVKLASRAVDFSSSEKKSKTRKESVKQTPSTNKTSSTFDSNDSKKEDGTNGEHKREKFKFWCKMCQVGAFSEHVMNNHKVGKKHLTRLVEQLQKGKVKAEAPRTKKACDTEEKTEAETKKAVVVEVVAAEVKSVKDDKQDVTAKEPDTLVKEDKRILWLLSETSEMI